MTAKAKNAAEITTEKAAAKRRFEASCTNMVRSPLVFFTVFRDHPGDAGYSAQAVPNSKNG
jgi:hypothetical protein